MLLLFSFQHGSVVIVPEEFEDLNATNLHLRDMLGGHWITYVTFSMSLNLTDTDSRFRGICVRIYIDIVYKQSIYNMGYFRLPPWRE